MRYLRAVVLVTVGAVVAMGINAAIAGPNGGGATGSRVTQVKTMFSEILVGTFTGWTDVTTMPMTVAAGTHAIIDVRFDAQGVCYGDPATSGTCELRILVGGKVAKPKTATVVAEQNSSNGNDLDGQWMIERSTLVLGPGRYQIAVQHAAAGDPTTYFGIHSWHLIAERIVV
jgi:hypothetical protein